MASFNQKKLLIVLSFLIVIHMANSSCDIYNTLDWGNDDINFKEISGYYSVITTNYRAVFGACEVHGISQEDDGSILDRYKVNGSPCSTVFQNRITKFSNAFQFEFFGDDVNCIPPGQYNRVGNLKMKVIQNGDCFFKSFCLPDGTTAINLLCRNPNVSLLNLLLTPVINVVFTLIGQSLYYIDQSCYNQIMNNQTSRDQLMGLV